MVERTISVHQDLLAVAGDVFKMRHKPLRSREGNASKSRLRGHLDKAFIYFYKMTDMRWFQEGRVCRHISTRKCR
jgi:hypothetical protein